MAQILTLNQARALPPGQLKSWAYGALDTTGTREVWDVLRPKLDAETSLTYAFERALQGPAYAMSRRGIKVNVVKRSEALQEVSRDLAKVNRSFAKMPELADWDLLEKVTDACPKSTRKDGKHTWAKGEEDTPARKCCSCGTSRFRVAPFNPGSPDQAKHLLYDLLKLKKQFGKDGNLTTDDEAILRLRNRYPKHETLLAALAEVANLKKQHGFLKGRLSPENRFHSNFNVGQAWTGRWSSSALMGIGSNAQNITERFRHLFEADPGWDICYADLTQAESNIVAHLSGDEAYIEAHKIGDPHTYVARLVWPDIADWTGDIKQDKKLAKSLRPPWDDKEGHDYRFQAKRIQHGSNFGLTPPGISMIAHIPMFAAREAFHAYHSAFPGISAWQDKVRGMVHNQERLVNPLGRSIRLFGRPWDGHTEKQGFSFLPQSTVADIINIAVYRLWRELELHPDELIRLLAQVHDAILFLYRTGDLATVHRALELMTVPIPITDINGITRTATVLTEAAVGKNWGHASDKNPHGIKEI